MTKQDYEQALKELDADPIVGKLKYLPFMMECGKALETHFSNLEVTYSKEFILSYIVARYDLEKLCSK